MEIRLRIIVATSKATRASFQAYTTATMTEVRQPHTKVLLVDHFRPLLNKSCHLTTNYIQAKALLSSSLRRSQSSRDQRLF